MGVSAQLTAVADVVRDLDAVRDDPCAAYKVLLDTIETYQNSGVEIPAALKQIEKDLSLECFAESQGR